MWPPRSSGKNNTTIPIRRPSIAAIVIESMGGQDTLPLRSKMKLRKRFLSFIRREWAAYTNSFMSLVTSGLPVAVQLGLHAVKHFSEETGEEGVDGCNQQADDDDSHDNGTDGVGGQVALAILDEAMGLDRCGLHLVTDSVHDLFHWMDLLSKLPIGVELVLHGLEHVAEEGREEVVNCHDEQADDDYGHDDRADSIGCEVALSVPGETGYAGLDGDSLSVDLFDKISHS